MRFEPNEDQAAFLSMIDKVAEGEEGWSHSPDWQRFVWSPGFDAMLEENGFLDCAQEETLGLTAAAAMVWRLARLPVAVECAGSALLRAPYAPHLPRPLAVIEDDPARPARFLPVARSALLIAADGGVRQAVLEPGAVRPQESLFAYPMGALAGPVDWQPLEADPAALRDAWRVALAAELGGVLKGGLDAVLDHVRQRHQFGRPLGSFQAVQHRLASAAGKIEAAYWLTLKAAQRLDPADATVALAYVQDASTRIVYDLHQFMGAMGLTLEHPLHRWTYRARLLRSGLGGAAANMQTAAERRWRAA